jgi:hypothetical protein
MKSVLTICPSRGRPQLFAEMMESFIATRSPTTAMIAYLNSDDPELKNYVTKWPAYIKIVVGKPKYISEVYNMYAKDFPTFDYYAPINDDHLFMTPQWDQMLLGLCETQGKGWGVAMADDCLTDWNYYPHPSGCVVSGKMVRLLGYMVYPKLHHTGIDVTLGKLCNNLGILFGTKDVVIKHRHWLNSERPMDDNHKWIYGKKEQEYGKAAVQEYLFNKYPQDFQKLKDAMADKKC